MREYAICTQAIEDCLKHKRFTVARLYSEQKTLDMHLHDCYELYFALSDGNRFFIDDQWYTISAGDLFAINNYETHHVFEDTGLPHERYVISIHPECLEQLSTPSTDLARCFQREPDRKQKHIHKVTLNKEEQHLFLHLLRKISSAEGYGAEIVENAAFSELMVFVNRFFARRTEEIPLSECSYHPLTDEIIRYLNQNVLEPITIAQLAEHFFLSESYICRIFKKCTGTTINKYLTARRISIAKVLLSNGANVTEACEGSGFNDYSNFIKAFSKATGVSPKRYGKYNS